MKFLEKDLEEIIHTTNRDVLNTRGLWIEGVLKRQLKIGNYGIADLVSFNRDYYIDKKHYKSNLFKGILIPKLVITVYELKKDSISMSAFLQAVGYVRGLESWFNKRNVNYKIEYKIVLIGKVLKKDGEFCYLPNVFKDVEFYTYSIDIDGLKFNEISGYSLINQGF